MYSEIQNILNVLNTRFSSDNFPLSNSILLDDGTEKAGLGMTLLECILGDVSRSQGASYLGVVLEEAEYFEWNGKNKGIEWRLMDTDFSTDGLRIHLSKFD
jgi:hypothetical protein